MQDKFPTFAGEFSQLLNNMSNMSQSSEVMNVEIFSALSRNVGKLREMKKAHKDMATEIALLRLEKSEIRKFLAEAKRALADTRNAQVLRTENQELFKENRQLKGDLESTQKLLEAAQKTAREQAEKEAESIWLLQDNLEARLVEKKVVDDDLLGQIIKDPPTNKNRRSLIGELGELIMNFRTVGHRFVTRLFPDRDAEQVQLEEIPVLMREMASKQAERLRSAVRGEARTCLALMVAHYRTAKPACLAYRFPSTVTEKESASIFTGVSGYATRIAEMVKV